MVSRRTSSEIHIEVECEELWQLLTRVAAIPTWYEDWDEAEAETETAELGTGTSFRLRKRGLLRRTARCVVVTVEPLVRLRWIEHRALQAPVLVEFEVLDDKRTGTGTVLRHSKTVGTRSRPSADPDRSSGAARLGHGLDS